MAKTELVPLTVGEKQEFTRREANIEKNLSSAFRSFFEIGADLAEIHENCLYREKYDNFKAYCTGKWDFNDRRARQLIESVQIKARIDRLIATESGTAVPPLKNEWQTRELSKHPAEYQADIWATAQGLVTEKDRKRGKTAPSPAQVAQAAEQVLKEDSDDVIDAESKEVVLTNGLNEECQPWEADFFLIDDKRKEVLRLLSNACKVLDEVAEEAGMEATNVPALKTVIKGWVLPHIRQSAPYAGCTECEGSGCARCYNYGFQMRAAFTKTAEEPPSDGQLKFLRSFEKVPINMPKHEVQRRLNAHIAYKRLTKPTKAMLKSESQ